MKKWSLLSVAILLLIAVPTRADNYGSYSKICDMDDVDCTGVADNDLFQYDSSSATWQSTAISSALDSIYLRLDGAYPTTGVVTFGNDIQGPSTGCSEATTFTINAGCVHCTASKCGEEIEANIDATEGGCPGGSLLIVDVTAGPIAPICYSGSAVDIISAFDSVGSNFTYGVDDLRLCVANVGGGTGVSIIIPSGQTCADLATLFEMPPEVIAADDPDFWKYNSSTCTYDFSPDDGLSLISGWTEAAATTDSALEYAWTIDDSGNMTLDGAVTAAGAGSFSSVTSPGVGSFGTVTVGDAFTLPGSLGTAGQVLRVPGSGTTLEWGSNWDGTAESDLNMVSGTNYDIYDVGELQIKDHLAVGRGMTIFHPLLGYDYSSAEKVVDIIESETFGQGPQDWDNFRPMGALAAEFVVKPDADVDGLARQVLGSSTYGNLDLSNGGFTSVVTAEAVGGDFTGSIYVKAGETVSQSKAYGMQSWARGSTDENHTGTAGEGWGAGFQVQPNYTSWGTMGGLDMSVTFSLDESDVNNFIYIRPLLSMINDSSIGTFYGTKWDLTLNDTAEITGNMTYEYVPNPTLLDSSAITGTLTYLDLRALTAGTAGNYGIKIGSGWSAGDYGFYSEGPFKQVSGEFTVETTDVNFTSLPTETGTVYPVCVDGSGNLFYASDGTCN